MQGLFVQHLPALRGFVLSLVSNFNLVDDIVQETFITVTSKAGNFERGTNFRAWAWTIARFKTLQMLEEIRPGEGIARPGCDRRIVRPRIRRRMVRRRMLRHLSGCIAELAPKARQSIELRYMQAHRPPEIARLMGWTVDAVHVALARARVVLRGCVTRRVAAQAGGTA